MPLIIGIVLILAGGAYGVIFFLRHGKRAMEMKYMRTSTIGEAAEIIDSMSDVDLTYRHYVELKGVVQSEAMVLAPFTEREVAYYENRLSSVRQDSHVITDDKGNRRTITNKVESLLSNEKSSVEIYITDLSGPTRVYLDMNSFGNQVELMPACDRFEQENSPWMRSFSARTHFMFPHTGSHFLGYRLQEEIFASNQPLYILGEMYKQGDRYYIGRSVRDKKPSMVSYKSEDEIISHVKNKRILSIVIGILGILVGAAAIAYYFLGYTPK